MATSIHGGTVVVSVRRPKTFDQLGPNTKSVHINGFPFLWLIEQILWQAPNIQCIEVTPLTEELLGDRCRQACAARGVRLITGYVQPGIAAAWKRKKEPRNPNWRLLRGVMLALAPEQQERFNELLTLKLQEARLLSRYLCLSGEAYAPQRVIARELQYSPAYARMVSAQIRAVIHYLSPKFKVTKRTARITSSMHKRVTRARECLEKIHREKLQEDRIKTLARQLGLKRLPANLPLERLKIFKSLVTASRDGRLRTLQEHHPNPYRAIVLRFGLEGGAYLTLKEVAANMRGITRARVCQHEAKALQFLGI